MGVLRISKKGPDYVITFNPYELFGAIRNLLRQGGELLFKIALILVSGAASLAAGLRRLGTWFVELMISGGAMLLSWGLCCLTFIVGFVDYVVDSIAKRICWIISSVDSIITFISGVISEVICFVVTFMANVAIGYAHLIVSLVHSIFLLSILPVLLSV